MNFFWFTPFILTAVLADAAQFKFGNQTFTVPDGFTQVTDADCGIFNSAANSLIGT